MTSLAWAALSVGLIIGFYWSRVIKLVFKTRRLTGKAANFLPPEPLGKVLRILWYPTVVAWVFVPLVVFTMTFFAKSLPSGFRYLFVWVPIHWLGVIIALVALYLTMICWRRMGKSWRMGIDPGEKTTLIVNGPYAAVRHPIYALQVLLVIATFLAVPNLVMGVVVVLLVAFLTWESLREEHYLLKAHGEPYASYLRQVPRFMPSVSGRRYVG